MLLSFLVVSPAALVYKNLRQNILVKAARKTGSQTRQTIRLAREPIDTHTQTHTHIWAVSMGRRTHTQRERLLTAKLRRNINKTVLPSLNLHINIRPTLEIHTYLCVFVRLCVCNCFQGQITKSPTKHPEKHNICSCMYAMCILNGAKVVTKLWLASVQAVCASWRRDRVGRGRGVLRERADFWGVRAVWRTPDASHWFFLGVVVVETSKTFVAYTQATWPTRNFICCKRLFSLFISLTHSLLQFIFWLQLN